MPETFTCEIQARLRDINLGGHVDNVEIIRVIEEARIRYFGLARDGEGDALLSPCPSHVTNLVASLQRYLAERVSLRERPGVA